ncbi:MAG: chemotaxis-specific protein-glutamate methyltransferase CheB, partial [Candidatus Omnitrophota bacterium]|nr:chemotaxis-specific protein-glutamate methyltransferase CheB [Candidatus Omnitrophota bacterium]
NLDSNDYTLHKNMPSIKVLIIDDSLFIRSLVSDFINKDPHIKVVDTASSGQEAMRKIPSSKPDCIILDLAMPGWDGLTTLKHIMRDFPTPVVILSAYSQEEADITLECLKMGAVSFVLKPSGELSLDIERIKERLVQEVKAAAKVDLKKFKALIAEQPSHPSRKLLVEDKIIVIGASTGGPQTLEIVLPSLPSDFSLPILVAQHMPNRFFSESLSGHLNKNCSLKVKVATDAEIISSPAVYLAPGGSHLKIKSRTISFIEASPDSLSPSIDMAMQSIAEAYKHNSIGIILSGIGNDGLEGMRSIKEAGGRTIVQDESALIFGMPKCVINAGLADKVLPAEEISKAILELAGEPVSRLAGYVNKKI